MAGRRSRTHRARRARVLMAGVAATGGKRDRRRHADRAGRAERQGDRMEAERRGDRGDRQDYEVVPSFRGASKMRTRNDDLYHPTNPLIAFTGALSGNTVSASTRSARPR